MQVNAFEKNKFYQYESCSTVSLVQCLFFGKKIKTELIEKIIYRLNHNLVCDYSYLCYMLGLEETTALQFLALIEIIKRKEHIVSPLQCIQSPKDFVVSLIKHCQYLVKESIFIGLLNDNNNLFELRQLTEGEVNSVKMDMKVLMKYVLCEGASRIIIGHNHPSGDPKPSVQDIRLTKRIQSMLSYFDLELLDHVIVGRKSYYSFKNDCSMSVSTS